MTAALPGLRPRILVRAYLDENCEISRAAVEL